ncbi:hypothetical protein COH20_002333 [Aspergillus flavus]|uniref:P-loop containing nucleoside triphosphate hydrolase protein n=1 Tax=Aspergillus flavus TaxID=5059 RepID=A0AB74BRU9_ASPFL|nr:hypothetical protein COH20_002333 [Aspergillus flavus]RAQ81150.1 hypothetical protein COH21_011318 [Aspergillus flavus]RMZ37173.1 hypothetical protein CA14_012121 [Aspergillus flavus]
MGSIEDFTSSTSGTTETNSPLSDGALNDPIFSDDVIRYHLSLLKSGHGGEVVSDESAYAPIISSSVLAYHANLGNGQDKPKIPQFGLLAGSRPLLQDLRPKRASPIASLDKDPRLLFNVSHPSSVFICGSQGSGKSHTLSCLLENCLIPSKAGRLPNPLTGLVFHYDTFISDTVGSPCEAAFLSSHPDVHVRVLCSPTNIHTIRGYYSRFNIPVDPLQLDQNHLNTKRMMDLMAIGQKDGQESGTLFNYQEFKDRILRCGLTRDQLVPLKQRLDTLESFMPQEQVQMSRSKERKVTKSSIWDPVPGRLTIVDMSCPCISPETACSLFNICLGIFLEQDPTIGRVVALDEAHKYMNSSAEAQIFTETLLSAVRLQRHLGTRVIISTQEPTISTDLLNLCSVTIVHRFTSPEWLRTLQKHLAAAACNLFSSKSGFGNNGSEVEEPGDEKVSPSAFDIIVRLRVGEALLFAPSAIVKVGTLEDGRVEFHRLGSDFLPIKVRERLTSDGGKSVLSV